MIKKIIYLIVPLLLSVVHSTDIEYNLIFKYNVKKMTDEQIESVKSLKLKLQKKTLKSDNKIMLIPTIINADSERIKFYKAINLGESKGRDFTTKYSARKGGLGAISFIPIEFYSKNEDGKSFLIEEKIDKIIFNNKSEVLRLDKEIENKIIKSRGIEIEISLNEIVSNLDAEIMWNNKSFQIINFELLPCAVCSGDYAGRDDYYPLPIKLRAFIMKDDNIVYGCKDKDACNYDSLAMIDDKSCWYANQGCDCLDGKDKVVDACGVCDGPGAIYQCEDENGKRCLEKPDDECDCFGNRYDCEGICGGNAINDECGVCNGSGIPDEECDCEGNVNDICGVCGGKGYEDECGVCDDDSSNDCVKDCNDDWGGLAIIDKCGICCDGNTEIECSSYTAETETDLAKFTGNYNCKGKCNNKVIYKYNDCGECIKKGSKAKNVCEYDCSTTKEQCNGNWKDDKCWGGTATLDKCDICDNDSLNDCIKDCNDVWGGLDRIDECGECIENGSNNLEFWNVSCMDLCNIPNGDNTSCMDCNKEPNGTSRIDDCGECILNGSNNLEEWNITCSGCIDPFAKNYDENKTNVCKEYMSDYGCDKCEYYNENIYFISNASEMFFSKNNHPNKIRHAIFKNMHQDLSDSSIYSIIQGSDTTNIELFMNYSNNLNYNKNIFQESLKEHGRQPKFSDKNQNINDIIYYLDKELSQIEYKDRIPNLYIFFSSEAADFKYNDEKIYQTRLLLDKISKKVNNLYLLYIYQNDSHRYKKFDKMIDKLLDIDYYTIEETLDSIKVIEDITILNCNISKSGYKLIEDLISK